jgi:hypothetical protein
MSRRVHNLGGLEVRGGVTCSTPRPNTVVRSYLVHLQTGPALRGTAGRPSARARHHYARIWGAVMGVGSVIWHLAPGIWLLWGVVCNVSHRSHRLQRLGTLKSQTLESTSMTSGSFGSNLRMGRNDRVRRTTRRANAAEVFGGGSRFGVCIESCVGRAVRRDLGDTSAKS